MKTTLFVVSAMVAVALAGVLGWQKLGQPAGNRLAANQLSTNQLADNQLTTNQLPANQLPENKRCLAEGEKDYIYEYKASINEYGYMCCPGLTPTIGNEYLGADGVCYPGGGDLRILCAKCGDGVCGLAESECNCPQDCGEPAFVKDNYRKIVNQNAGPWQTYRNEQYGFEIKYPVNWHVYPSTLQGIIIGFSNLSEAEVKERQESGDVTNMYSLTVKIINGQIDNWLQGQQRSSGAAVIDFLKEKITIGENEGYKISGVLRGKREFARVLFTKEKVYLVETLFPEECRYEECEIFSQMLSTFKFIK